MPIPDPRKGNYKSTSGRAFNKITLTTNTQQQELGMCMFMTSAWRKDIMYVSKQRDNLSWLSKTVYDQCEQ